MRRPLLLVLLALAACAPSRSDLPASSAPPRPMRVETDAGTMEIAMNNSARAVETLVPVPVDAAWTALQRVYVETGIPITVLDAGERVIGNQNASVSRRLISTPLSTFLDCGRTAVRTPIADQYAVNLTLLSELEPRPDSSVIVRTLLQGRAKNPVNNDPAVQCASTGRLEALIASEIVARAGG